MKVLATVLMIALAAIIVQGKLSDEQKAKLKGLYTECVASSGVNEDLIKNGRKGIFVEDAKLADYYSCMLKKMGILEDNGTVHADKLISKLPDSIDASRGAEIIKKCSSSDVTGSDSSKVAINVYKCFVTTVRSEVKFFK